MPNIEINGVKLWYVEEGSGEPIVFVHGIPTDYRAWNAQAGPFSRQYRVITYSRRYAHPNNREGNFLDSTIQNNASDLAGLVEKLGISPVHLIGHSYGGFIAAYLAVHHPELIRDLILIEPGIQTLLLKNPKNPVEFLLLFLRNPSAARSGASFTTRALNPLQKAARRGDFAEALRFFLDGIQNKKGALGRLPESARTMMTDNAKTVRELDAPLPIFTRDDARRISASTLLINGETSVKFLHAIVDILSKSIPKNEVSKIPGSGHFPHVENPDNFNSTVMDFLKRGT